MSAPAAPPPPPPEKIVRVLRYRSRENRYKSEAALERDDLVEFQDRRHSSQLEQELADTLEAEA